MTGSIAERATALLAALGDTETQVAANLLAAGITGHRGGCTSCPIAVYLLRSDLGCYHVEVSEVTISLFFVGQDDIQDVQCIDALQPVEEFIYGFDFDDRYAELVAGGAR